MSDDVLTPEVVEEAEAVAAELEVQEHLSRNVVDVPVADPVVEVDEIPAVDVEFTEELPDRKTVIEEIMEQAGLTEDEATALLDTAENAYGDEVAEPLFESTPIEDEYKSEPEPAVVFDDDDLPDTPTEFAYIDEGTFGIFVRKGLVIDFETVLSAFAEDELDEVQDEIDEAFMAMNAKKNEHLLAKVPTVEAGEQYIESSGLVRWEF